ncbi:sugar phosphate isomerase/epimerase [Lutibacter sp.]|uniref:sugar phosphate isomerase/epimerase family protein n=1 Tax=Lutibacter sp. TaxID=1925666 RepID=UPI002733DE6A|nr:sugar phosphate isomerase/epimerase family protein [Lutibacter sp.]MDP3312839.1 sugar phosphate isomerase/epimerase family protein [Lutibacter sp.]
MSKSVLIYFALVILGVSACTSSKTKEKEIALLSKEILQKEPSLFFKISLAQWSLNKAILREKTLDPLDFAKKANELGFDGIEYVSQLYKVELAKGDNPKIAMENLLKILKINSEKYNVENVLIMVDGEGDLASLDNNERSNAVENHKKWVDAAAYLGCHSIRVNAHGKGSSTDVANAAINSLSELADYAKEKNINVIVENHGGYTSNGAWLADVMTKIGKDNCGTLPDFGNFCQTKDYGSINSENCKDAYDIYKGVKELMPFAKGVSAKSYDFDSDGNQPKIDYVKMLQIVKDAGYKGYIGVEYEGNNLDEIAGIMATKNLMIKAAKMLN